MVSKIFLLRMPVTSSKNFVFAKIFFSSQLSQPKKFLPAKIFFSKCHSIFLCAKHKMIRFLLCSMFMIIQGTPPPPPPSPLPPSPNPSYPSPPLNPSPSSPESPGTPQCNENCTYSEDNSCDDGGPGSEYAFCALGTDCNDCSTILPIHPPPACCMALTAACLACAQGMTIEDYCAGNPDSYVTDCPTTLNPPPPPMPSPLSAFFHIHGSNIITRIYNNTIRGNNNIISVFSSLRS